MTDRTLKSLARLEVIPRRTIYLFLFVACAIPFLVPIRLPLHIWKETRSAFDVTSKCPPGKVIAISSSWVSGSQGENWPQYEAVVAHCMLSNIPFVVFAVDADPMAPQMAEIINQREAKRYGKVYGRDWVNLGLTRGAPLTMGAIGRSVKTVFQTDFQHTSTEDYAKLPLMKQVRTVRDFYCLWAVDYQPDLNWVVFLDPTGNLPVVFACAGIVSPTFYSYVSSGQLKGLMVGTRGAAEYEELLRDTYGKRFDDRDLRGNKLIVPLAFGHLVIIAFIVAGNIGMAARRRQKAAEDNR
ncbi:MAG: hypothetical protein P4L46_03120 [Fimbriimonas sp.]|nr:hypothetical protein [Fimbriimonas sp.]